jgi:hypothetical protein
MDSSLSINGIVINDRYIQVMVLERDGPDLEEVTEMESRITKRWKLNTRNNRLS